MKASVDGGRSWQTVVGAGSPAISLQFSTTDPTHLFASFALPPAVFEADNRGVTAAAWHQLQGCPSAPLPALPASANVWIAESGGSMWVSFRAGFQTDDEGFRNAAVRARIDVAALGDSFTDATTVAIEEAWPTQLERQTGLAVQNYGTAGFGPQQELLALKDYAVRHHPRVVVLAYFAGNDLFDAEAFDDFARSGGTIRRAVPGWRIKDVVSRADTWFLVSALRATGTWVSTLELSRALQFYLPDNPGAPDVDLMLGNRLAQNTLLRRFCERRGISFLDTTDALTARFAAGDNVYFPDESHLNELGHAVVAATLAAHLQR